FVHAGLVLDGTAPRAAQLHEQGFTHAHVIGTAEAIAEFDAEAPTGLSVVDYPMVSAAGAEVGGSSASSAADSVGPRAAVDASDFLALGDPPALSLCVLLDSGDCVDHDLARLQAEPAHGQRHGYRLLLDFTVDEAQVDALGQSGVAITVDPARAQPLSQLLAAGAQVSLSHSESSPWASVRAAVVGDSGIGARAGFNAATRFAHRAAGNPEGGVLAPGAEADIVRWRVERLVVQVADPRVAAWSTDPRSGTPGLPELAPDVPL